MPAIRLGNVQLEGIVGWGSMGTVWRGLHQGPSGAPEPVAVKVLNSERTKTPGFLGQFRREVAAQAGLDHPNIVAVFDHGIVPDGIREPDLDIQPGLPWLVMELGEWGTLADLAGKLRFEQIVRVMVDVLGALAHAHARGVVHCDVKPSNVLVGADGRLMLSDFGFASALDELDRRDQMIVGTPLYMAPEQVSGLRRDYGPWTDLYAAGGLAWALTCGAPPFEKHAEIGELLRAHLLDDPPPLTPTVRVAPGFEGWLRRLLARDANRRFRRAADALEALRDLPEAFEPEPLDLAGLPVPGPRSPSARTATGSLGVFERTSGAVDATISVEIRPIVESAFEETQPMVCVAPPMGGWRSDRDLASRRIHLRGAGLALYGLRRLPLVGREAERDALWSALREVTDTRRAGAVVLAGPSGVGKSRLAGWLCERAHELGAASSVHVVHAAGSGGADAIGTALRRDLRCLGLDRQGMVDRVDRLLRRRMIPAPDDEALALVELMRPASEVERALDPGIPRLERPQERYALVERHLGELASRRPLILWIDDVQWGVDALHLVDHLLRPQGWERPILVVLTARDDLLAERAIQSMLLDGVLASPRARRLPVRPLVEGHAKALVRHLIGLDSVLAARVEERTSGNPLFAVQLVGDWVQRGVLQPGRMGFQLAPGATAALPDDLYSLWSDRIDRLLAMRPAADRIALELMATLGEDVSGTEWEAACTHAGVRPSTELVEQLVAHRLAEWTREDHGGWILAHSMLREALERSAREGGRALGQHRICAELVAGREGPGVAERLARHWIGAGEASRALVPLRRACGERDRAGDASGAAVLTEEYARCLAAAPDVATREDHLWVRWRALARARTDGDFEHGLDLADALVDEARAVGARGVLIDAIRELGHLLEHLARLDEALEAHREAAALAAEEGDRARLAVCTWLIGTALWKRGHHDEAELQVQRSLSLSEAEGDRHGVVRARVLLATIARQQGRLDLAARLARIGLREAEAAGFRGTVAKASNVVGEVARLRGDREAAVQAYRKSIAIYRALGSRFGLAPAINLGLVLLESGRYAEARAATNEVLARSRRLQMVGSTIASLISLLPCDAVEGAWTDWDRHFEEARLLMDRTGFLEEDCPRFLRFAAELAIAEGHAGRAREALRLAAQLWRALGRPGAATEVEEIARATLSSG